MNPLLRAFYAFASRVGFYACDSVHLAALRPGVAAARDIRERLGPPAAAWSNPDGGTTWEYPRGPEGVRCWMLTLSGHGILQKVEQALTEENFSRVGSGWSAEQVRRLLGRPASEARFPLKPEVVWEWRIEPKASGNRAFFHVHFSDCDGRPGQVTGTSRREETPGV